MSCAMPKSNISADLPGLPALLVINLSQPKTDGAIRQPEVMGETGRIMLVNCAQRNEAALAVYSSVGLNMEFEAISCLFSYDLYKL